MPSSSYMNGLSSVYRTFSVLLSDYDGNDIVFESSFLPEYRIIGLYIIADLQLCFADSKAIVAEFRKSNLALSETCSDGKLQSRTITENNNAVYLIEYQKNGISVINKLRNYDYTIEFLY